ncbi:MAG: hypothetical protein RIT81_40220 [Deltaproteobacteria bacterium]
MAEPSRAPAEASRSAIRYALPIKLEFFTNPVLDPRPGQDALNRFRAQRNVLAVDRHPRHGARRGDLGHLRDLR